MLKFYGVIFIILLSFLSLRFYQFYSGLTVYEVGQEVKLEHTFLNEPRLTGFNQTFYVENLKIYVQRFPEYHYGDTITLSGEVEEQEYVSKKNGQVITEIVIKNPKIETRDNDNFILAVGQVFRQKIVDLFDSTLPPVSSSLLMGIVFGIKKDMPYSFFEDLRNAGVLHVIAASGMNVALVGGFISGLLGSLLKRQTAILLSMFAILFYAFLSGFEPSIVRASIMGILAFSAQILGRQNLSLLSLFLAGYGMLLVSPKLLFDIGFQLSFVSTLGLIYIPRAMLTDSFRERVKKTLVGDDITTTISAQLATLPILLANFGTYSLWSVAVNGVLLWVVPVIMVLGGVGAVVGMVVEPLGKLFLYLSFPFLMYFEKVVVFFGDFEGVSVTNFPWTFAVGYYCILISLLIYIGRRRHVKNVEE
ncbi:MAG: ComEC/Rec2 family competence protein [Armatimonadetes bacterium]|nr:MAG: ComEC/Rec2 family competence protein [Armatimonadota bacterium]